MLHAGRPAVVVVGVGAAPASGRRCVQASVENAAHVRNAIARFNQVEGVTAAEKDAAWELIKAAARKYSVEVKEKSWHDIGH
jgi:hypothetical protein